ncbi:tRNA-specific adenosine deaminase [Synechococcales cyanobacterium C]|uniref:tRNA-specific adenosine deaminase n=1 Tax=Petrachloros mirabilis ULC683 TaxID=2781853 RepID=A0A8K1ZVW5_9CYAN|nr:tRNA adenosine(34) deaminase TadA [Petrachloros mirabilis]NCJ05082.1 tRNA-specific adenosine deaminase [Petrachloros mirabilis ULC683]
MLASTPEHHIWMDRALSLAAAAGEANEVPVGAVLIGAEQQLISESANRKVRDRDPTAHAEILAIRMASQRLQQWHLEGCTLYVTLEPCPMCAGAILQARLSQLIYGADDPKTGAIRTVLNLPDSPCSFHQLKVLGGIRSQACRQLLQHWFEQKRQYPR